VEEIDCGVLDYMVEDGTSVPIAEALRAGSAVPACQSMQSVKRWAACRGLISPTSTRNSSMIDDRDV
jgi:hypothetical protein